MEPPSASLVDAICYVAIFIVGIGLMLLMTEEPTPLNGDQPHNDAPSEHEFAAARPIESLPPYTTRYHLDGSRCPWLDKHADMTQPCPPTPQPPVLALVPRDDQHPPSEWL